MLSSCIILRSFNQGVIQFPNHLHRLIALLVLPGPDFWRSGVHKTGTYSTAPILELVLGLRLCCCRFRWS